MNRQSTRALWAIAALALAACGNNNPAPNGQNVDSTSPTVDSAGPAVDAPSSGLDAAVTDQSFTLPESGFTIPDGLSLPESFQLPDQGPQGDVYRQGFIGCGSQQCDTSTQICCAIPGDAALSVTLQCQDKAAPCQSSASCNGSADCGSGQSCCAMVNFTTFTANASCQTSPCPGGLGNYQLCYTQTDCGNGQFCCEQMLGTYSARICTNRMRGTCF
jgi:hypothetical protein